MIVHGMARTSAFKANVPNHQVQKTMKTNTFKSRRQKQLTVIAYHEAGHAIAQWRLGFKIKEVTIVPKGDVAGSVSHKRSLRLYRLAWEIPTGKQLGRYHDMIITTLAGEEAQRRFSTRSVRRDRSASDYRFVNDLLCRLHDDDEERFDAFRYLRSKARSFVNHPESWMLD
jgi:hypothetical protein